MVNRSMPAGRIDGALLILRIWMGLVLFVGHGLEKLTHFSQMAGHFPNPIHIGSLPSFLFAFLSDAICSLLVLFGIATRYAALIVVINVAVAFTLVHHMALSGPHSGQVPLLFLGAYLTLVIAGPGRYSVDATFSGKRRM